MSDGRFSLPEDWQLKRLGEISVITGGGTPRREEAKYFGGPIPWATPTDIDAQHILPIATTKTTITEVGLRESSARLLDPGTVLFSSRASIGKIAIAVVPMATNQGFANLTPGDELDSKFLAFGLSFFKNEITKLGSGTTFIEVSKSALREFEFPFPALSDQRRIVSKLDSLFAQSRSACESLDRVPALLKRFRQAVLAAAFRGELTERDSTDEPAAVLLRARYKDPNKAKHAEREPLDTSNLPELPETWCWTSAGEVIDLLQYGTSVKADSDARSGVAVLRMGNIQEGQLDFGNLKYIDPTKDDFPKYLLEKDDILINRTNSPELVGKAAIFEGNTACLFASYLIRLRANPQIMLPRYLTFVINSEVGRRHIAKVKHQVAGQANINSQNIRQMPIPLAPLDEQRRVVAKVQSLFGQAEIIERAVQSARRQADKVDQAILARAFRGQL